MVTDYVFKQLIKLPKGTTLHAGVLRQLVDQQVQPGSRQEVWWGDQTWEEMMFTGLIYIDPVAATGAQ
jgi:hypothetical protein